MRTLFERLLLPVVMVGLLAILVVVAHRALAETPRFQVDPGWVAVAGHPDWLSAAEADRIAVEVASRLEGPLEVLDRTSLETWKSQAVAASPWVLEVIEVEARFPYQADLQLVLRRPVVELSDGRLLTADGVVLNGASEQIWPLPVRYAGSIADEAVIECAAAAGDLLPFRAEVDELVAIAHVSVDAEGLVVFTTASGARLQWGRSVGSSRFAAYDLPPASRVANLREVVERYPGLVGVAEVKLWYDRPQVVEGP